MERLTGLIEQEQLKNARAAAQLQEEQQRVELLRQENMTIAARADRSHAQLQEAERCIGHMQRAADLKVEAVRQDVLEYTSKSKALITSPTSSPDRGQSAAGQGGGNSPLALPASSAAASIAQPSPRPGKPNEVEELKAMVTKLRRQVSGIDAAVSARATPETRPSFG